MLRCCHVICHYFQQPVLMLLLMNVLTLRYTQLQFHTWWSTDLQVELMIQVLVNLLGITVLPQKPPQYAQPAHPQDLGGQTCLTGTSALTYEQGIFTLRLHTSSSNYDDCFDAGYCNHNVEVLVTHRNQCVCPWPWPPVHALPWLWSGS